MSANDVAISTALNKGQVNRVLREHSKNPLRGKRESERGKKRERGGGGRESEGERKRESPRAPQGEIRGVIQLLIVQRPLTLSYLVVIFSYDS